MTLFELQTSNIHALLTWGYLLSKGEKSANKNDTEIYCQSPRNAIVRQRIQIAIVGGGDNGRDSQKRGNQIKNLIRWVTVIIIISSYPVT